MKEIINIASLCIRLSKDVKVDLDTVLNKFYEYDYKIMTDQRKLLEGASHATIYQMYENRIKEAYELTEKYFKSEYVRDQDGQKKGNKK